MLVIDRVLIVGAVSDAGFRVSESYFFIGRRAMNRKRWMEIRP